MKYNTYRIIELVILGICMELFIWSFNISTGKLTYNLYVYILIFVVTAFSLYLSKKNKVKLFEIRKFNDERETEIAGKIYQIELIVLTCVLFIYILTYWLFIVVSNYDVGLSGPNLFEVVKIFFSIFFALFIIERIIIELILNYLVGYSYDK